LVQAISETIIWVVGITVIADVVPIQHIGITYTTVFMASSAGNSVGPMLSGLLYQLAGYWPAWSSAFAIIGTDIVFRLLMIESPNSQNSGERRAFDYYG
jgi:MFS family permease